MSGSFLKKISNMFVNEDENKKKEEVATNTKKRNYQTNTKPKQNGPKKSRPNNNRNRNYNLNTKKGGPKKNVKSSVPGGDKSVQMLNVRKRSNPSNPGARSLPTKGNDSGNVTRVEARKKRPTLANQNREYEMQKLSQHIKDKENIITSQTTIETEITIQILKKAALKKM